MAHRLRSTAALCSTILISSGCPQPGEPGETAAPPGSTGGSTTSDDPSDSTPTTPTTSTGGEETTLASTTAGATTGAPLDCATVEFVEPALEAAVRGALAQPDGPLLGADVATLTSLYVPDEGLVDLAGLECATGLEHVTLSFNEITDIGPLAGLVKLQVLNLRNNPVADIGPLAGLAALRELVLDSATASDLTPLSAATALEHLDVSYMPVESLAPLANLTALRELHAQQGAYVDIEPLAGLTALVSLNIADTAVADLSPLAGLAALDSLTLDRTDVADLAPLAGLSIRRLFANGALISDVSPVATFPTPLVLELTDNAIVEVNALLMADWSVPESEQQCLDVMLTSNPLSAAALAEVLPAFCAATGAYVWADGLQMCEGATCILP